MLHLTVFHVEVWRICIQGQPVTTWGGVLQMDGMFPLRNAFLPMRINFSLLGEPNLGKTSCVDQREESMGTSFRRKSAPLGPYSRTMPRALWWR